MKLLLNAGFGNTLGPETISLIRNLGFSGIRQDMLPTSDIPALLAEIVTANFQPILLIKEPKIDYVVDIGRAIRASGLLHPSRPAPYVEIIGEPDWAWEVAGGREGADGWGAFVAASAGVLWSIAPRIKVISGGITTTDRKRLDFLARGAQRFPAGVIVGYHTYRTTQEPWVAWPGFATRHDEMLRLRQIAAGRRIFMTEVGWHTAPSKVGGWLCNALNIGCKTVQYNDAQVAEFALWECRFNAAEGADGVSYFQLNDGPNPNAYEHRFGIRHENGVLKPVAEALRLATSL